MKARTGLYRLLSKFNLALIPGLLGSTCVAQFSIDWSTVDGGGGTSRGAMYCVSGTIGQPDAGGMKSENFSLVGGFGALPMAVQTTGAPLLSIEQLAGGLRVFWPATATGFVLEESLALASSPPAPMWSPVAAAAYETNVTHIFVMVPMPIGSKFYRLRK